uniref:Evasin n=1 Tax=Amblyomma maculatum TaxID=34609 RepID=G3MKY5_AMBMU
MRNICIFTLAIAAVASAQDQLPAASGCADTVTQAPAKPPSQEYDSTGYYKDQYGCLYLLLTAYRKEYLGSCYRLCAERDDITPTVRIPVPNYSLCLQIVKNRFQERKNDDSPQKCRKGYCWRGECKATPFTVKCSAAANRTYGVSE